MLPLKLIRLLNPTAVRMLLFAGLYFGNGAVSLAQMQPIKNDTFWNTKEGQPIYSQGGGIFRFKDPATKIEKYYWYGVHYKEADQYRRDPSVTLPNATFEAVTCYSSTDLVNWKAEGNVVTREDLEKTNKVTWVGRLGVAYVQELKQYAMFVQFGNQVLVALADKPAGTFSWHQLIDMKPIIGTPNTGDQTVFTDPDTGTSYLVYSYGRGRNRIYISEIGVKNGKVGLLDCKEIFKGASREGNCMFKYHGKYYMAASNIYGWDASYAYHLVADDIRGPYLPVNYMQVIEGSERDYAHVTQTGFFVNVKGSQTETVLYCGDRWANFAGNGLGYNQWFPLSFKNGVPYFNSLSSWNLDVLTGSWQVAADNNYVSNGSFEADRNRIPSHVKPVQTELLGWTTEVLQGNKVSLDSSSSPVLNYFNKQADRRVVTGEKAFT
ncbi:family 43 glycosylhydrolase [Niabella hibiscisoli]|uniref:family 43 glycosylhydrolase n=1 Tax=Niabella hibiscisoli TaxID=1825928 RepID=UPI001F0FB965|nr:family 43 glycosylhydrolase [Niabella hibiscisoli]MCH5718313.1 family 43 glycosylhydrolase [Niabella hibiscisoli]